MRMRAKRTSIWLKLAPLWVGLWLMSFGCLAQWQHFDGTFCATCTDGAPEFDADCQDEAQAEISTGAPDDCHRCCALTSQPAPDKLLSPVHHAAILSAPVTFALPIRPETRLNFSFASLPLDFLPRPPPRGRAPPLPFSISSF
ncbi:MAG TPA: hypothetical protein VF627_08345 [Abditibacterium sp.]